MATTTFHEYNGDGSDKTFDYSFPTYTVAEVVVEVDGVLVDNYTVPNYATSGTKTVTFDNTTGTVNTDVCETSGAPKAGTANVRIRRDTNIDAAKATYQAGSSVKAGDLNSNQTQVLRALQEEQNTTINTTQIRDKAITTAKIKDLNVTTAKIAADAINGTKIADNSIDSEHYIDGSIDAEHIASNAVTTAKILDDNVTLAKLGSGALPTDITVASANLVDGTIVNADVNSNAAISHSKLSGIAGGNVLLGNSSNVPTSTTLSGDVTVNSSGVTAITAGSIVNADIADDAIDHEHLAANSVREAAILDNAVTTNKLPTNAVTSAKIATSAVGSDKIADNAVTNTKIASNAVTTAKIHNAAVDANKLAPNAVVSGVIANNAVTVDKIGSGQVTEVKLASNAVTQTKIADNAVIADKIASNAVTSAKIVGGAVDSTKLSAATVVTASEQASATANDTTFFTTSASDARYFNVSTGDTIKDGQTFPDNDTTIATTAAINDRILDLVDDVGGFVPIANETSFPNANPDADNGTGTIVSVATLASNHTSNGSGVISISNGTVGNSTVTINGAANSTTYSAGYGLLVETTSTLNTYTFHRLVPKATEVTTVAGKATEIGRLGTAATVEDLGILGTTAIVEDMSLLGTTACVADMALLGDSAVIADMATIADTSNLISNIGTVAGIQANVTTVAGNSANVTTVATNMGTVNDFGARYRAATNNAGEYSSNNDAGDLYFNTEINALKVWTGSAWVTGVTQSGDYAVTTGNTFTGNNIHNDSVKVIFGTHSDAEIYHNNTDFFIDNDKGNVKIRANVAADVGGDIHLMPHDDEYGLKVIHSGGVEAYYGNAKKFSTTSHGVHFFDLADTSIQAKFETSAGVSGYIYGHSNTEIGLLDSQQHYILKGTKDAATELYYDNSKTFQTTSYGAEVIGVFRCDGLSLLNSEKIQLGNSGTDLEIYHDGTQNLIEGTAPLYIKGSPIVLYKGGSTEKYFEGVADAEVKLYHNGIKTFQTDSAGAIVYGPEGGDGHLYLYADEGDDNPDKWRFNAEADTSRLTIENKASGSWEANIVVDGNGSASLYYDNSKKFETTSDGAKVTGDLHINDNQYIKFGASDDLIMRHEAGGSSRITYAAGQGNFYIGADDVWIRNSAQNETKAKFITNGAVELYYDNSKKLETTSTGVNVTGATSKITGSGETRLMIGSTNAGGAAVYFDGDSNGDVSGGDYSWIRHTTGGDMEICADNPSSDGNIYLKVKDGNENAIYCEADGKVALYHNSSAKFETTASGVRVPDSTKLAAGNADDVYLYHNGSDGYISNETGNFLIYGNGGVIYLRALNNEEAVKVHPNGPIQLFYDDSLKFHTTSAGVEVEGRLFVGNASDTSGNGNAIWVGDDNDMKIYHDGWDRITSTDLYINNQANSEQMIHATQNGYVGLFYDGSKKFETIAAGCRVASGNHLYLYDNGNLNIGNGNDLSLWHNGSDSYINNITGDMWIRTVGPMYFYNNWNNEYYAKFKPNDSLDFYYDASHKFSTASTGVTLTAHSDLRLTTGNWTGESCKIQHHSNYLYMQGGTNGFVFRHVDGTNRAYLNASGHWQPAANNTYDLGTTNNRWRNVYTADLQMSNEGSANEVDGTWGNYTIQEGEDDLFLINRRNGKKYKFNLTEVS